MKRPILKNTNWYFNHLKLNTTLAHGLSLIICILYIILLVVVDYTLLYYTSLHVILRISEQDLNNTRFYSHVSM